MPGGEDVSYSIKLDLDRLSSDVVRMRGMIESAGAGLAGAAVNMVAGGINAGSAGRTFNEGMAYAAAGQGAGIGGAVGGVVGGVAGSLGGPGGAMAGAQIGRAIGAEAGKLIGDHVKKGMDEAMAAVKARQEAYAAHDARHVANVSGSPEANLMRQAAAAGVSMTERQQARMFERAFTRSVRTERMEAKIQARAEGLVMLRSLHLPGR